MSNCREDIEEFAEACRWSNPHLTLRGTWSGKKFINVVATNPQWDKCKVLEDIGCSHVSPAAFFGVEKVNRPGIATLLASKREHEAARVEIPWHHRRGAFLGRGQLPSLS